MAETTNKLDRASLWMLGGITLVIVIGGILQVRSYIFANQRNVTNPLLAQVSQLLDEQNAESASALSDSSEAQDLAQLQTQDTDNDGLNDFEEQYIYNTSAFLPDSDSDGIDDKTEISQNTNPNCPEGEECLVAQTAGDGTVPEAASALAALSPDGGTSLQDFSPEEIRQLLRDNGVDEEVLAQTDDATLLQLAQETAAEVENPAGTDPIQNVQNEANAVRNLSIDQKRVLLIDSGVDAAEVEQLSEDQVNELIDLAVDEAVKELTDPGVADTKQTAQ